MRRLLFALIPVLMTVTPVGAAKADSIKVILKGPEEETAVSASFAVFQDSACKKPVKENDRDMVVTVNEDGFIPDDLDENLYLREASAKDAAHVLKKAGFASLDKLEKYYQKTSRPEELPVKVLETGIQEILQSPGRLAKVPFAVDEAMLRRMASL